MIGLCLITGCSSCVRSDELSFVERGFPTPRTNRVLGLAFMRSTIGVSLEQRELMVRHEIESGNIPDFLKTLAPLHFKQKGSSGAIYDIVMWTMPDYLAIGSNADFIRVPMNPLTAQAIANRFGYLLPTRKIVDLIYQNANIKLTPHPKPSGPDMTSSRYFIEHNREIQSQLQGIRLKGLIAGHKKDVVISERLVNQPGRVAIYGWHQANGIAIQPLSLVHNNLYADYSHGIRLIRSKILVNGHEDLLTRALGDPELAPIFSDEGPLKQVRYRLYDNVSQLSLVSDYLRKFSKF